MLNNAFEFPHSLKAALLVTVQYGFKSKPQELKLCFKELAYSVMHFRKCDAAQNICVVTMKDCDVPTDLWVGWCGPEERLKHPPPSLSPYRLGHTREADELTREAASGRLLSVSRNPPSSKHVSTFSAKSERHQWIISLL